MNLSCELRVLFLDADFAKTASVYFPLRNIPVFTFISCDKEHSFSQWLRVLVQLMTLTV